MTQAIITEMNNNRFLLIYEENELVECHPLQKENTLQIENIYIDRVEKVVKNIQSAFVRLDEEHIGYLPLNDKPALVLNRKLPKGLPSIAEGDTILVQVEQEPQKMKQARVTGNICLSGDYVALDLNEEMLGVSKKIRDENRSKELKELILRERASKNVAEQSVVESDDIKFLEYGCVMRTACENASNEAILAEYRRFSKEMDELIHKALFERNKGCVRIGECEYLSLMREYGFERIDEIKTDLKDVRKEMQTKQLTVGFYEDSSYPFYKLLGLESELQKLLNKKVWLKSGGFLMIEPTEAMVVIDVNTGKSIGKKNKDSHILKLNLEAAKEITKQLRLRNLSGIIMIDFINMSKAEDKQEVVRCIEQGLKKDKIPGYFVEITKLDVFELTRKKVRRPLYEAVNI